MDPLHSLLARQLKRLFGDAANVPKEWGTLVRAVNDAYREFDSDRAMLERSLELSSHELLQATAEMRAVFQAMPDLLFHLNHEGTIISVKAGTTADLLLQPQALSGKRLQNIPDKRVGDQFSEAIARVLKEQSVISVEYSFKPNGYEQFYEARFAPLPENELIVIVRNITERKRSEESLLKLSRAVEQAADAVLITNAEGVIEFVNPSFEALTGYGKEELLGKTPRILKSGRHNAVFYSELWSNILSGKVFYGIMTSRKKNGQLFDAEKTITPVKDAHGKITHFVSTDKDMTERMELQTRLRQAQKMEAFGQLAAGVAHDFNNILTVIQCNASMLQSDDLDEKDRTSVVSEILRAAERAANLTRQLLTFSRRQPIQARDLDLNEVVVNVTKMLQRLIGEHISLEARYAPGGALVHADPGMMEQVLMNLAVNSRDAMPKGGRLVVQTTTVVVDERTAQSKPGARPGDFVRLGVSDTGQGVAPEHLAHIFEPFFTTKDVGKGTGLGLATVFGIVEQHHGWIEVESKLNVGTTFHVYLPRLSKSAFLLTKPQAKPAITRGTETILLAEDESPVRELVRRTLLRHGYKVHEAASGAAALRIWNEHKASIDLLITDMVMPEGVGGRELAERIKSEKPELRVLYCTGYTDDVLGEDSLLRDGIHLLEKPFTASVLLQRVRDCLDKA